MSTSSRRVRRRAKGLPTWRIVRYADDFAVLVHGHEDDVQVLREEIAEVLATMGLAFSEAKTRVVNMSDGFDFLGFHIQWRRKMGTNQWHVYTFIADRPIRSLKAKIRALTNRTSQRDPKTVLSGSARSCAAGPTTSGTPCVNTRSPVSLTSCGCGWRGGSAHCITGRGRTSADSSPALMGGGNRCRRTGSRCSTSLLCR